MEEIPNSKSPRLYRTYSYTHERFLTQVEPKKQKEQGQSVENQERLVEWCRDIHACVVHLIKRVKGINNDGKTFRTRKSTASV